MAKRGEDFSLCIDETGQKVAAAETGLRSLWNLLIKNCKLLLVFEFSADSLFWLWTGSVSAQSVKKARLMGRKCREMPLWSCLDRFQSSLVRVAHRDSPAQFLSFTRRIQQRIGKKCAGTNQTNAEYWLDMVRFCSICLALHCSPRASSCSTMRCKPLASSFTCPKRGCQSAWHGQPSSIQRGLESVRDQLGAQKSRSCNDAKEILKEWVTAGKGRKGKSSGIKDTMLDS